MQNLKVTNPYLVVEDSKCIIIIKNEKDTKYLSSTLRNKGCGKKYNLNGTLIKNKNVQLK